MLDTMFRGLFDTDMTAVISVGNFLLCVGVSLVIGLLLALGTCTAAATPKALS